MSDFDPDRRLVMQAFKTVLGHSLPVGTPLAIVQEPSAPGEVDQAMAKRLWAGRNAVYAEDYRPTPVETPQQEATRMAVQAVEERAAAEDDGEPAETPVTDDLQVWPVDDGETGKKKGDRVTKDDLLIIAAREDVAVESDDNKPDLQRKIVEARAARALAAGEVVTD